MKHRSNPSDSTTIDVYPVGVLDDLLAAYRTIRFGHSSVVYLTERARAGNWRAVRNSFNGYLAEPYDWPEGLKGCGHGWTKRRALRSLADRMRTGR